MYICVLSDARIVSDAYGVMISRVMSIEFKLQLTSEAPWYSDNKWRKVFLERTRKAYINVLQYIIICYIIILYADNRVKCRTACESVEGFASIRAIGSSQANSQATKVGQWWPRYTHVEQLRHLWHPQPSLLFPRIACLHSHMSILIPCRELSIPPTTGCSPLKHFDTPTTPAPTGAVISSCLIRYMLFSARRVLEYSLN